MLAFVVHNCKVLLSALKCFMSFFCILINIAERILELSVTDLFEAGMICSEFMANMTAI